MAFALAFLTLFGLLVAAVLGFSETGLRSARALSTGGDELAAATGALDGAINRLRDDLSAGTEGSDETCFAPPAINGVSVTVRCRGEDGSGRVTGADNVPTHSIVTLGTSGDGLRKLGSGSAVMNVTGSVSSATTVNVNGTLAVSGDVDALGNCTGTITASAQRCANNGGGAVAVPDPAWAAAAGTPPPARTAPSCDGGWLVRFEPGTYNDADALYNLMRGAGSCSGDVFWFRPGVYSFHFTAGTRRDWRIDDPNANVIAGTPLGWSSSASSRPTIATPGGCDATAPGVQFIFGADSRLDVRNGSVELCADPHQDEQRIAIYGMTEAAAGAGTRTSAPSNASSATYAPPAGARVIDGSSATRVIPATNPGSAATLTASGFAGIPAGARITAASLRIAHRETPTNRIASVTASVQPASGSAIPLTVTPRSSMTTDTFDLLAAGLSPTADGTAFTVTYTATARSNQSPTVYLDGFELAISYSTTGFVPQSGCVTAAPFPGASACAFVATSGSRTSLVSHGTIYAPGAAIDLAFPNNPDRVTAMRRGVVARQVRVDTPASWAQSLAPFAVPPSVVERADREVELIARIGGVDRVRALVRIDDDNGEAPGNTVTIDEWSVV